MSGWHVERADGRTAVVDDAGKADVDVARFLDRLEVRGLSPHTVEAYAFDLAIALRWMDEARVKLTDLRGDDLHKFIAWERGRASQPKSINRRLNTLRLFFRFVVGLDMSGGTVAAQPYRATRKDFELGLQRIARPSTKQLRVKESRAVVEPLTIDQVRELLVSLPRYRDLCIAHAMLLCGLRSTEVLLLRLGDIDFEDRRIRVRGKGSKERMVPLPALLIDLLRRYLALERPRTAVESCFVVLQGRRRGQPMTRAALRKVFRTRRQQKGLSNANPHRLRHTFGTDMARTGVRLPILQKMMGHAFPETTLQYVNVSMADVAAEFHRAVTALEARYGDKETQR